MKALCVRPDVHGVILVMSSKPKFDEIELTNLIPANKDVGGLSAANLGVLVQNDPHQFFTAPATPRACIALAASETELKGKHVVVIGQGTHGREAAREHADKRRRDGHRLSLRNEGYSANHPIGGSRLRRDREDRATSERNISRTGRSIIDAGIGFIDGKLAGDVDIASLADLDVRITPVPGGVGPLTSVLILENLLKLIEIQGEKERLKLATALQLS